MNLTDCRLPKTHKEIVRIMVSSIPIFKDGQATSNTKARAPLPGFSGVIWDEWGKKGVRMDTKALKKQMGAAIAMVLVAAVALGSATFAWFVSNNTVKAETATISAQSNAPFLKIDQNDITENSKTSISFVTNGDSTELYPAQVVNGATGLAVTEATSPLFQSAYAGSKDVATILTGSRYDVGAPDTAVTAKFAINENFKIGTVGDKAGSFKNLKVSKVEVTGAGATEENGLKGAVSVLLVCGDKWAVYKASTDGTLVSSYYDNTAVSGNNTNGILADEIGAGKSVDVKAYVFYDGSAEKVYTENLASLKNVGVNISFTATPVNTQGQDVANANNAVTK